MIRHTKRVRKALSSDSSVEEGSASSVTVSAPMEASDEALKRPPLKVNTKCVASIATALTCCHRLAKPALRASADGGVVPESANPGVGRLAPKSLFLEVH